MQGCAPPPPEMTCGFLIQPVFCQKKTLWFIGVEIEQETSAPLPKKNPGSASDAKPRTVYWPIHIRQINSSQFLPEKPSTRKGALHSGKKNMGPKLLAIVRNRKKGSEIDKSHLEIIRPVSGLCWLITFFSYRKSPKISPSMYKPPQSRNAKNSPLNCPSKYTPPGACNWKFPSNAK